MADRPTVVRGRSSRSTNTTHTSPSIRTDAEVDLGRATDELNAAFEHVERRLKKLGIVGSVPLDLGDFESDREHSLSFQKMGGRWRLIHLVSNGFGEDYHGTLLTSEPRWLRVAAAAALSDLVAELRARAAEELRSVQGAIASVNEVLTTLPPGDDADDDREDDESDPFDDGIPF